MKQLLVVIGVLSWAGRVSGDPLPAPTLATVVFACVSSTQAFGGNSSCDLVSQGSNNALSGTFSDGFGTLTVDMSAAAGYGILKSSVVASVSAQSRAVSAGAIANAAFLDQMTISFDPFNGSLGYWEPIFTLDGENTSGGSLDATLDFEGDVILENGGTQIQSTLFGEGSVNQPFGFFFKFIYGQPFAAQFLTIPLVETAGGPIVNGFPTAGKSAAAGSGSSIFSDTVTLTGIEVFDQNMNPVHGETFTSGSGTIYTENGVVPTPEPSGVGVAAVLLALIGLRRRSKASLKEKSRRS